MRILAVDDDTHILEVLEAVLLDSGYQEVVTTASPLDALRIATNSTEIFDCLLLDIQMPEMDGIALCRRMRMIRGYEEIPIVMLTAMTEREYVARAFEAGATDYLTKPFDVLEIGARLRVASKLRQAQAAPGHLGRNRATNPPRLRDPDGLSRQELVDLFADEFRNHANLQKAV